MLGEKIHDLRKDRKLTQQDLATIIGVNRTTITGYEKNIITPSPDKLVALCEYFDVTTDYLIGKTQVKNIITAKTNDIMVELDLLCDLLLTNKTVYWNGLKMDDATKQMTLLLLKSAMISTKQWINDHVK